MIESILVDEWTCDECNITVLVYLNRTPTGWVRIHRVVDSTPDRHLCPDCSPRIDKP